MHSQLVHCRAADEQHVMLAVIGGCSSGWWFHAVSMYSVSWWLQQVDA